MNVKNIFGENLKQFRKSNKITQEELSEKLSITPTHLSRIENGKSFVTAELLDSLCGIFNISPATFFYSPPPSPRELSDDHSFFAKMDSVIDSELQQFGVLLKEKIRK
ncbi:MAG: helix-turn-helix transcriptional regulator [Spirochaetaceae bacterium]|nr:helix-turn-helix transcriptional regulator [Spirochaetaceae bacterium]